MVKIHNRGWDKNSKHYLSCSKLIFVSLLILFNLVRSLNLGAAFCTTKGPTYHLRNSARERKPQRGTQLHNKS